ncbi:MAG: mechanosensitive ion channel family protein [Steroidobacteraceae bacterium]
MSMDELQELASRVYLGNELQAWAAAAASFALWFTVLPMVRAFVVARLEKLHPAQSTAALELALALLGATTRLFLVAVAIWVSQRWLVIPPSIERTLGVVLLVIAWLQVGLWGMTLVTRLIHARQRTHEAEGAASLNILRFIAVTAVWAIALLMLLANLGVEIMPLVAGLGIGGLAIALAVQNVLGDLLASLSIALDKPFKVGDFLVIGEEKGTVQHIGIKSTRIRSLSGELIVMSNGDLLKSRVRNYGLLYERRASFTVGIVYETPRELVGLVPGLIEEAIRAQPKTRFDRAHFANFGEFALLYEAVYFVLDAEYNTFMNIQQAINLRLVDEFAARGIEFAYPTSKQWTVMLPAPTAAE